METVIKMKKVLPSNIYPVTCEEIEEDKQRFYSENDPDDRIIGIKCSEGKLYTIWKSKKLNKYMLPIADDNGSYIRCSGWKL